MDKKKSRVEKISESVENKVKKKIGIQNYVIVAILFIITLLVVLWLRNWYVSYQEYKLTIPVLRDKINEVAVAELDSYLNENIDTIVYMEVSEQKDCRELAKGLYNIVKKRNLIDKTVFVNLSSVKDKEQFLTEFSDKYMDGKTIKNYPALVVFNDGKVVTFVAKSEKQKLRAGDIEQLFDEYELEGD